MRSTCPSASACPVFVAVTERRIRVRTQRRAVLINTTMPTIRIHIVRQLLPVLFCSIPFRVLYLPTGQPYTTQANIPVVLAVIVASTPKDDHNGCICRISYEFRNRVSVALLQLQYI